MIIPKKTVSPSLDRPRRRRPVLIATPDHRLYPAGKEESETEVVTIGLNLMTCECDTVLADGGTIHLRPIHPDDGPGLEAFHSRLSPESIYLRFFGSHPRLSSSEVQRFTHVDGTDRMALVATLHQEIVGVARYDRLQSCPTEAEVAFVVSDAHQGRGLGTLLLEHLAGCAHDQGIATFVAETLPQNSPMREVFRNAGFAETARWHDGVVEFRMDIRPSADLAEAVEARDRSATVHSIGALLRPRSVAVIGAGRGRGTIGHEIFHNLIAGDFAGPAYPIHPSATSVAGVKAYPSVVDVPGPVDLAVIAVPGDRVAGVVEECATKGVKGAVVISAGYAESGADGRSGQHDLVCRARGAGIRLIGPNCMGMINTAPDISMNATFAPGPPTPGRVAFASQSGGLGIASLEEVRRRGIGLSSFVSVGNKADVSGNDLLQYWGQDDDTDVILLYLESFGNARRFAHIAGEVSRLKPIVALKAGRTSSGRRAASSHTAALATSDAAVDALFARTGVIRVDTLEELFDVAEVLDAQPLPFGPRVAIVGNAGGPGILAADACETGGLEVRELSAATQAQLRTFLPAAATVTNPVDMVASASAADYRRALRLALDDDSVDAVVAVFAPPLVTQADDVAAEIADLARGERKPIVACFLGMATPPAPLRSVDATVPSFTFPEPAVRALARTCRYAEWCRREPGQPVVIDDTDPVTARAVIRSTLDRHRDGSWLPPAEAARVLSAYKIPVATTEFRTNQLRSDPMRPPCRIPCCAQSRGG